MPSLLSTRLGADRIALRSTFEAGRSVMAPTSHSAVVPAKARTHNHWISLLQRSSAACGLSMDSAVWVPAFGGDDGRVSVIAFPLLPFAAARAGPAPFAQKITQRRRNQSLLSPCCHLRRCNPNHDTMIAAKRNGIIALEIAAPSPSWPAMIAR